MSEKLSKEVISQLNEAWLNIKVKNEDIINPFDILKTDQPDEFHMKLTWLMMQPDYFSFVCKHIMNIELLPIQALILKEMWNRKFPMLIGSRGLGKAISVLEPILTETGWVKMGDIKLGDRVYSRSGFLCNVTGVFPQGQKRICKMIFNDGREIECCEDHLWVMKHRTKEVTISTKEIIKNGVKHISPSGKWIYKFRLPNCEPIQYSKKDLPIDPYILGCLLGDGTCTTLTPKIASDDQYIVNQFKEILSDFDIKADLSNNNWTIVDKNTKCEDCICGYKHRNSLTAKICRLGLNVSCKEKFIPDIYKTSSIEDRMSLIQGLLDTDGSVNSDGSIEFSNTSEILVNDIVDVLRSLGISCIKKLDDSRLGQSFILPSGKQSVRGSYYRVYINTSKKVFRLPRKVNRLKKKSTSTEKYTSLISAEYTDSYSEMQCISVDSPDHTYITKDYIVTHNTFLLSLYCLLRALLMPNRKIVVVGAAYRQSKFLHNYMENIWKNAPILQDICDENSGPRRDIDMCKMTLNGSVITALPIGNGEKIRGQRANDIISDEFASSSRDIFENVIAGFGAVSASPADNVKKMAKKKLALELGLDLNLLFPTENEFSSIGNQIILSGTAYYDFNHFADYWRRWKAIIQTKGDPKKIKTDVFNGETPPESFNWRDYSIIRIPVDLVPKGFMDDGQIARSKATVHNGIYLMEFGAVFCKDSQGFFKRTLIESCVGTDSKPVKTPSGEVFFDPMIRGNPHKRYVMGVDPASEVDNFSIVLLELNSDHRKIVYCWTITRKEHIEKVQRGLVQENNFYSYCARKIRELMSIFNVVHIAMDSQGGGISVSEALHDNANLKPGEAPIWPIIEEDNEKPSDDEQGLHILELCNFAKYDWYCEANHGLRKDFEDKAIIFPRFDPITIGLSIEDDKAQNRLYDTLEDCVMEIEELKNELSMIEMTQTQSGRDRWDTPEVKAGVGKKKRLRKDRYSALLMSNMASRLLANAKEPPPYMSYGGFASPGKKNAEVEYIGPAWFTDAMKNIY